jgi:hypothetical protein
MLPANREQRRAIESVAARLTGELTKAGVPLHYARQLARQAVQQRKCISLYRAACRLRLIEGTSR